MGSAAGIEKNIGALEQMQDELMPQGADFSELYAPKDELYVDRLYHEEDLDAGKTDRYIVVYKDGQSESFKEQIDDVIDTAMPMESARISGDTGVFSMAVESRARNTEIQLEVSTDNLEVLVLEEAVLPSEFAEKISTSGATRYIEYIQPDFVMNLDSLSLELEIVPAEDMPAKGGEREADVQDIKEEGPPVEEDIEPEEEEHEPVV